MYVTLPTQTHANAVALDIDLSVASRPELCLKDGAYLFFEGDDARRLYRVTEGVLRLTRLMQDGRRQVIAFGFPGDVVGFPSGGRHHTDCEALLPARVVSYKMSLLDSEADDPVAHQLLLQAALREIGAMQDHFLMLGRKSASEKVASFLVAMTERLGAKAAAAGRISLPMPRSDIADFLGLTTETVSRTFTQFRKSGIIALENIQTVIVLKPDALLSLAESCD